MEIKPISLRITNSEAAWRVSYLSIERKIRMRSVGIFLMYIQGDSVIKVSILGSDIISRCEKGTLHEIVSHSNSLSKQISLNFQP